MGRTGAWSNAFRGSGLDGQLFRLLPFAFVTSDAIGASKPAARVVRQNVMPAPMVATRPGMG